MKRLAISLALVAVLALAGCAAEPEPPPTATTPSSSEPTPADTPSESPTPTPTPTAEAAGTDWRALLVAQGYTTVESVTEREPGWPEIQTGIEDPGGGVIGSLEAQVAIEICNAAVALGATRVTVLDIDGSSWILYGHPAYGGNVCTEV